MFASMVQLTHRNTRRYGGYIVHFGVVVVMIGFAGSAFNQDKEAGMGFGDHMEIGSYDLVCRSYTQDDNAESFSEWAFIDVYQNGNSRHHDAAAHILQGQPAGFDQAGYRSRFKDDLYLVYEGQNDKGQPIIKAHLNPLVMWIWIGVWIMLVGTDSLPWCQTRPRQ